MSIAVLTSGGDSPGMNACLRAVVRKALHEGICVYGVNEGFKGLYDNNIYKMNRKNVAEIINRGGTVLKSARFPEFSDKSVALVAKDNLDKLGVDTLFVIGGNGSYQGGMLLSELGVNVVNLPGTIDNDILGTDYTIGFDTAINTVVEAIDKVRDTSNSHRRASVVEVMGRHNGDIAFKAGLASGAEAIVTPETGFDEEMFINNIKETANINKSHVIVIVSENFIDISYLSDLIKNNICMDVNKIILGHIQRGGSPSAYDRYMATMMGQKAVDFYMDGITNVCISLVKNEITAVPFDVYKGLNNKEDLVKKDMMMKVINDVK